MILSEALRHRVRCFCDGAVLGSAEFVGGVFEREKAKGRSFGAMVGLHIWRAGDPGA
jgi:hypothetical protein